MELYLHSHNMPSWRSSRLKQGYFTFTFSFKGSVLYLLEPRTETYPEPDELSPFPSPVLRYGVVLN
jgi:hypothetical protein